MMKPVFPKENDDGIVYQVYQLTLVIKDMLEGEFPSVWVEGEVSNLVRATSGHLYFSLKDDRAQLPSVMFRGDSAGLGFELEDGASVLARGRVSVYPPSGRYQLIVSEMKPLGVGLLHLEFEKLKRRLAEEGLFDESRKKALPPFPRTIGIVTSPRGAAIRDMISITGRRYPLAELVLYPVRVQGEGAAGEIAAAIADFNRWGKPDLLIVGRGGGSLEDLWTFNEEVVARAIAASVIPVVSAVGHEIDFTISDLVADVRAPTPSAAAEIVVPDSQRLLSQLVTVSGKMRREVIINLERLTSRFRYLSTHHGLRKIPMRIEETMQRLDQYQLSLRRAAIDLLRATMRRLGELSGKLDILSPLATLGRGYSLTRRLPEGSLVYDAATLSRGDMVGVRLRKGEIECEVKKVRS